MNKYILLIMILLTPAIYGQTIADKLSDISDAKTAIKAAVETKGVEINDDVAFSRYDEMINKIAMPAGALQISVEAGETIVVGDVVSVSTDYVASVLDNPIASGSFGSGVALVGYAKEAGNASDVIDIIAIWYDNPLFVFDEPTQTITGYLGAATDLIIPDKINGVDVLSISDNVFLDKGLTSVTLPSTLTSIQSHAFEGNSLTSITLPSSLESIEGLAFAENLIEDIVIPDSVTNMDSYAFYRNRADSITIGTGLTQLEGGVFSEARYISGDITSVTIPANITTISANVFYNLPLTSITFDDAGIAIYDTGTYSDHRTLGTYGEGLAALYAINGSGTYNYDGTWSKE